MIFFRNYLENLFYIIDIMNHDLRVFKGGQHCRTRRAVLWGFHNVSAIDLLHRFDDGEPIQIRSINTYGLCICTELQ